MKEESIVWEGSPSQITNLRAFVVYGVLGITLIFTLVAPILAVAAIVWKYLVTKNTRYELTSERLKIHTGVLSKTTEELELYRVKDTRFNQPFVLRLFKLGSVLLITSDKTTPRVEIVAISEARALREQMRNLVEVRRDKKVVREVEMV